ncbi:MAG: PilZ domain-containing protein [Gemmatimonadetes bacterium]|nr:PilZ domain-containing protein [Gemmatimonadota bacterium]
MARADERRWHYRIRFPERAVPHLVIGREPRRVLDVSEGGLRYLLADAETAPEVDAEFAATLRLHEGREVAVRAVVARVEGRKVSCRLHPPGIPLNVMFAEQRWLLRRYPLLFRAAS